jgi:hypothetical protein
MIQNMGMKKFEGLERAERLTLLQALSSASETERAKLNRLFEDPSPTREITLCIKQRQDLLQKFSQLRKDLIGLKVKC